MTHQQYLLEQFFNLIGVLADELGQGGEVRDGIAGQRFKDDVGLAAPLDWISRLEVMPLEYANRMIFSKMAGS